MFSENLAEVEQALAYSEQMPFRDQQTAMEIINNWADSGTVLMDGTMILSRNQNTQVRMRVASAMNNMLQYQWRPIPIEYKNEIKRILVEQIQTLQDNKLTLRLLCKIVSTIASFDLPNGWENFFEFCFINSEMPLNVQHANLLILGRYAKTCVKTELITKLHAMEIREQLIQQEDAMLHSIELGLQTPEIVPAALKCLFYLLFWTQNINIINRDLIDRMLREYLVNPATQNITIKCLRTIFLKRNDTYAYFRVLAPIVIIALATSDDGQNPSLPITHSPRVKNFLVEFMTSFVSVIRILATDPTLDLDEITMKEIEMAKNEIFEVIQHYGVTQEQFSQQIIYLINIILSFQEEDVTDAFWDFWIVVFRDISQADRRNVKALIIGPFFKPLLPEITESLYRLLKAASDEEGNCSPKAKSCFSSLASIDTQAMIEFLDNQELSISYFFALCSFDYLYDSEELLADIGNKVVEIIEQIQNEPEPDPDLVCALMGMCARLSLYFENNTHAFGLVINFTLENSKSQEKKVANASASALCKIISNTLNFLSTGASQLAQNVIEQSESFMLNLDSNNMKLLFVACTSLIKTIQSDKERLETMDNLFAPVLENLKEFYNSPEEHIGDAILALDIILNCATHIPNEAMHYGEIFIGPLMELLPNIVNDERFSQVADYCLGALANIICISPYEAVSEVFNRILEICNKTIAAKESIFKLIAVVRNQHVECDSMWGDIFTNLVAPALELDVPPLQAIASMTHSFDIASMDFNFVVDLTRNGLESFDTNVNEEVIEMWKALTQFAFEPDIKTNVGNAIADVILPASFRAIFDMMHSASLEKISQFIAEQIRMINDQDDLTAKAKANLLGLFNSLVPEPEENLYQQFLDYMFHQSTQYFKQYQAISNLISALRVVSPVDANMFKITAPRHGFFSMLFPEIFGSSPDSAVESLMQFGNATVFLSAPFRIVRKSILAPK